MENQTSFDLNAEIRSWRENLDRSTTLSRASLDELESHLRDSAISLEKVGLSAEEAFLIAVRRIGPAMCLEAEFAKVEPRSPRLGRDPRYLYGIALIMFVLLLGLVTIAPLLSGGIAKDLDSMPPVVPAPAEPRRISSEMAAAQLIHRVLPAYTVPYDIPFPSSLIEQCPFCEINDQSCAFTSSWCAFRPPRSEGVSLS